MFTQRLTALLLPLCAAAASHTWESSMLGHHNDLRGEHRSPPLSWDSELEASARKWAGNCVWEHSHDHGENLALGYNTPRSVCSAWGASERADYSYSPSSGFASATGHFTQMVWRDTERVGCAEVYCPAMAGTGVTGLFIVCHYDPPGNMLGRFESNVLEP